MSADAQVAPTPEELTMAVLEGFVAVCHAPDDPQVRADANARLARLDERLADTEPAPPST